MGLWYAEILLQKMWNIFSKHNARNSPENFLPLSKNRQKSKMISLSYDVNDHVY